MVHDLNKKADTIGTLEEQRIVYLSDLWTMEEFMMKQEIENIMKCKMDNFDYIKLKSFTQTKPMQPRLGGKQKTGKEFLQLVSVIKASSLK